MGGGAGTNYTRRRRDNCHEPLGFAVRCAECSGRNSRDDKRHHLSEASRRATPCCLSLRKKPYRSESRPPRHYQCLGKITDANKATEEVTGYARNKLIGRDFSDYFTEPEVARRGYQQVFADGFVKDYPLAIQNKSGGVTDVMYNATVYRNEVGEVQGVFAAARDVTELKRAEGELQRYSGHLEALVDERTARLKESDQQYRTLVETANNIILTTNTEGSLTFVNDYGASFFGYTPDELIGQDIMIIVPEVESTGRPLKPLINSILASPAEYNINLNENVTKDGRRVWIQWANESLIDRDGRHVGHLATGVDFTDLKKTEEALKNAERLAGIGETAAMVGHDLRNPLQVLQYVVDLQRLRICLL